MKTPTLAPRRPLPIFLEVLEDRIAPAGINETGIAVAVAGSSILLKAGEGLGSGGPYSGGYYLYVENGQALVFTTDLDGNGSVDPDEITGIAAGDGLRLLSFVDIHGDIVTNLNPDGTLTDSDGDASNGRDGRILLDSRIEAITMRSVTNADVNTSIAGNDGYNRLVVSNYSIYGNIYAGGGLGTLNGGGISIDPSGFTTQNAKFTMGNRWFDGVQPIPSLGSIYTGTATSGKVFSFGTSPVYGEGPNESIRGVLGSFVPVAGQAGGDVIGIRAGTSNGTEFAPAPFHIGGVQTGNGGFGAKGGDIRNVQLQADVGTFFAIAGNGGDGVNGGNGGSIIGFNMAASATSVVDLKTGNGGQGLIGRAGAAGTFQASGAIEAYGNFTVGLGKGGDALGNAGAGTSLSNATFTLFEVGEALPAGFVTSMREPGDLGASRPFDFNGDGFNDAVFLTQNTQQLAVAFGDIFGGYGSFLILDPSGYANPATRMSPIVVGDFNGDNLPDIASASSIGTGFGGIKVFLNQGNNPISTAWQGFGDPQFSPSPLGEFGVNINMVAGDFDQDGVTDLALLNQTRSLIPAGFIGSLILMSGLTDANGNPDGFFAANFGLGSGGDGTISPTIFAAVAFEGSTEVAVSMQATATTIGDANSDIIALLTREAGDKNPTLFKTFKFQNPATLPLYPNGALEEVSSMTVRFSPRTIEEVEIAPNVKADRLFYEDAELVSGFGFAVADADGDGFFDPVIFGTYGEFTVASVFEGAADGSVTEQLLVDNRGTSPEPQPNPSNYYGIALTAPKAAGGKPQIPRVINSDKLNNVARAIEVQVDPVTNRIAYGALIGDSGGETKPFIQVFDLVGFNQYGAGGASDGALQLVSTETGTTSVGSATTIDMYFGADSLGGFVGLVKPTDLPWGFDGNSLISNSLALLAGRGGFSFLGNGGAGGSLGSGVAGQTGGTLTGSIVVNNFSSATFQAGQGGSGFLAGGSAGSLQGIATQGVSRTFNTFAGGNGLLGNGGNGGNISGLFYQGVNTLANPANLTLITGDGGFGLRGGTGGSVSGKGLADSPDVITSILNILAGDGGFGMLRGGNGGAISGFLPQMGVDPLWSASLSYETGSGGDAAAGVGGIGGTMSNSSPTSGYNLLSGGLELTTGDGGDGLTGGAGGSILEFFSRRTGPSNPFGVQVIAGDGGDGVTGNGGSGGTITGLDLTSRGTLFSVTAGDGGLSTAAIGGVGGSITGGRIAAETGSLFLAAGEGGDGLVAGGAGGVVSNNSANASALNNGRVVAVAGDGGDAIGVNLATIQRENPVPLATNPAAWALFQQIWTLGTQNGRGGNGGSIVGLTQSGNTQVSSDLIAGNGGSTINYGVTSDRTTGVGRGGSINNVKLAGDAGIMASDVAIRSYVAFGDSMSSFVQDVRDGTVTTIDQTTGNVGILVGNSGFIRNGAPATAGVAGSVSSFEAKNIMSMIAGSVDRIAAIVSVSGLRLVNGGTTVGAFKTVDANGNIVPHINGNAYYSGENYSGVVQNNARPGGSLVDGAVVTFNYSGPNGRVFDL